MKTVNSGNTWQSVPQDVAWSFRLIDFVNDSIGWATGILSHMNSEEILKTVNGGLTWESKKTIYDNVNNRVCALSAVGDSIVYIVITSSSDQAGILKSSDSGDNWEDIYTDHICKNFCSAWFFNADYGLVSGWDSQKNAMLLRTNDGGESWKEETNFNHGVAHDFFFVDDSIGYCLIDTVIYNNFINVICKTDNAFRTWPTLVTFLEPKSAILTYCIVNDSTIYAVVRERIMGSTWCNFYHLLKSTDAGITWETQYLTNWALDRIYFPTPLSGIMLSSPSPFGGNILKTSDAGESWNQSLTSYPFHDVYFINKNDGIACGGKDMLHFNTGNVFLTQDGG